MNSQEFCSSFRFVKITFNRPHQTDRLTGEGSPTNYIGQLITGSAKLVCGGKTVSLLPGEPFFIPKGCNYRSFWYPDGETVSWYSLGFDLLPFQPEIPALQKLPAGGEEHLNRIFAGLTVCADTIGHLYLCLSSVSDRMEYENPGKQSLTARAAGIIRSDPTLRMDAVASACGVSESTLYSRMRSIGVTPNVLRQRALCDRASELLSTTDKSVEDISSLLGFSSSSYFRKVFRSHTGMTPREVRKKRGV